MNTKLPEFDIVLIGVGHTHAEIVRQWRMNPIPRARLTCVTDSLWASYSGMLPGVLAGQYPPEQMMIDLVRFCASAGARLVRGQTVAVDRTKQQLILTDHPPIRYDLLSIGIGSRPSTRDVNIPDDLIVPIKPMQTFLTRLQHFLQTRVPHKKASLKVCIVGGGVGGVEIVCCLPQAVSRMIGSCPLGITLVHGDTVLAQGLGKGARDWLLKHLNMRKVTLELGRRVVEVLPGEVVLDDSRRIEADIVIWATSATAPPLLEKLDLPRDSRGFLETNSTLQSVSDPRMFVVGDSGSIVGIDLPKAGVFAVRQGPILWRNLRAYLENKPLRPYRPQRDFLRLINTGDGRAIADYRGWSTHAGWAWHWKDRIDGRFMAKYQRYEPPSSMADPASNTRNRDQARGVRPRCAGCGSKLGANVLRRVLSRLEVPRHPQILCGLEQPDDAALLRSSPEELLSLTVDFFTSPVDDPYLFGRIAALHAASDCYAFGGEPIGALAVTVIPIGNEAQQEQMLEDFLRGGLDELRNMGATLLGGHTMEGAQLAAGFSMVARHPSARCWRKSELRPADRLILTKPLGTGVLLAAHMQAACRAEWWEPLMKSLLQCNRAAAECAARCGVRSLTDITGFGLAGHLLEMLEASRLSARLDLRRIPLLLGAEQLIREGWESTLTPQNRSIEGSMDVSASLLAEPAYQALFDPQTSGGLLMAIPAESWGEFPGLYLEMMGEEPACIGEVLERTGSNSRLHITRGADCLEDLAVSSGTQAS
jgi:selenide, water dikinase